MPVELLEQLVILVQQDLMVLLVLLEQQAPLDHRGPQAPLEWMVLKGPLVYKELPGQQELQEPQVH